MPRLPGRATKDLPAERLQWPLLLLPQGMDDEANHRDEDAGIGHIERRPGMRRGNMQIEEREDER